MQPELEVSVVLPCLNESETLGICITKAQECLARLGIPGEVLVADNGSTDSSREIATALNARVVDVPIKGYGSALWAGFKAAKGQYIIMGDADDSYSLDDLEPYIRELRKGSDLVMGNRFAGTIHKGAMPWLHKYIGNPALSFIGRILFKSNIRDFHCGMRGLNRNRILELNLHTSGMEFASELVVKAIFAKYTITEVPTDLKQDGRSRAPHLRTWRDGWRHLRFLLSYSPKWLFFYPGLITTLIGLFGSSLLLIREREFLGIRFDLQTLVFCIFLLFTGTQLIWFALLAKASSISRNLMPFEDKWKRIFRLVDKEQIYLLYLIPIGTGIFVLSSQITQWVTSSFGELNASKAVRTSLLGVTLTFIGIQAAMSHFLLSIVLLRTNKDSKFEVIE
jgi:glycosyltransferase involved in cell wall biosynthesis